MTARVVETAPSGAKIHTRSSAQGSMRSRAPFSLRCGAILIDYIILVAIIALSTVVSRLLGGGARSAGSSSETAGILLAIVVAGFDLGILPGLTGMTVGKWATGLRIRRSDGTEIGVGRAFLRHFIGYPLSFFTLGLGFLAAAFNQRRRGLHDVIADTVVLRDGPAAAQRSPGRVETRRRV
ncbi:MAG: RDD family protein [Pyrinomonadaceae bacterium]